MLKKDEIEELLLDMIQETSKQKEITEENQLVNVESQMQFKLTSNHDVISTKKKNKVVRGGDLNALNLGNSPYLKTEEIQIILHNPPILNDISYEDAERKGARKDEN